MKKFLLIDGNSLIHRAFYALPLLTNQAGEFTNAAYGFTTMLLKILEQETPDYIVVCFDKGRVTFRTEQYQEYKAHRKATPPELRPQFGLVKRILSAMNIAYEELEGYEADDLIGTFVHHGEQAGHQNLILTGDRDTLQLISPTTVALLTKKGISEIDRYDEAAVQAKYGLTPAQLVDLKGLMGDASDNIPGVPGVGEKTALKLLQTYGTVENLLDHLDEVSGAKLKENLVQHQDLARLSKKLAAIECCVPIEADWERFSLQLPDYPSLLEIFRELEFKSLLKGVLDRMSAEMRAGTVANPEQVTHEKISLVTDEETFTQVVQQAEKQKKMAVYVTHSGKYLDGEIKTITLAFSEKEAYSIIFDQEQTLTSALKGLLLSENIEKIVYNEKEIQVLFTQAGIVLNNCVSDVLLGAYLLNPSAPNYNLESLCLDYLNRPLVTRDEPWQDNCVRACSIWALSSILESKIVEFDMEDLYRRVELPLAQVLAEMERFGVKVDAEALKVMSEELGEAINKIAREIYILAGEEFNINSPKQMGVILFEKLGLPPLKKTKTGYSTDAEVLEQLAEQHEIVAKILEHRTLGKLKSTYADGLHNMVNPKTGKVHTSFNQAVTATGRLSSTEPNLQNIPIRLEMGRQIRKVFLPSQPENWLLAADYSQIELRILAHISGDPVLIEAFRKNQDIHTRTAAEVFGVPMDMVTEEMRRRAKAVNFGIVYGLKEFGLARDLNITRKEAKKYIDSYSSRYQGVADYQQRVVAKARETGYVTTLLNRRRYLPDILSSNYNVRGFGERTAMNTPIQGTAADIIKLAMVNIFKTFKEQGYQSKMILQVHDELIFDLVPEEVDIVPPIVKDLMETALPLDVPVTVDLKIGKNWYHMNKVL